MRGTFHAFRERHELMVTFHPAALLRNPAWKKDTWADVQLLRKRYDELGGKP
jgi:DNA polymerase